MPEFDTAQMRGIEGDWVQRSLALSPVLVGTAGQAIDDPMAAVFGVAIESDFHSSVGNI